MESVIGGLYRGDELSPCRSAEEQAAGLESVRLEQQIRAQVSGDVWKLYLEAESLRNEANGSVSNQVFVYGFRLGAKMMLELLGGE